MNRWFMLALSDWLIHRSLSQKDGSDRLSESDLELSLDGNICRCTGYTPILRALKQASTLDIEVCNQV